MIAVRGAKGKDTGKEHSGVGEDIRLRVSRQDLEEISSELARATRLAARILSNGKTPWRPSRTVPHFDSILELDGGSVQRLAREIGSDTLIDALMGSTKAVQSHFLQNLNEDTARMIREEMDEYGPVNPEVSNLSQDEIMIILLQAYARRDIVPNGAWLDRLRAYA